ARSNHHRAKAHLPARHNYAVTPLVLGAAPRAGPVDDDLSFNGIDRSEVQKVRPSAPELVQYVAIVPDDSKEQEGAQGLIRPSSVRGFARLPGRKESLTRGSGE